jgi:UDP-3-O-[3-hydroxymyristoyl] glucosamine N-acyltransferase
MKVCDIVSRFGGECVGDSSLDVLDINAAADARPGDLTFAVNRAYLTMAEVSDASVIVVPLSITRSDKTIIRTRDVLGYVADLLEWARPAERPAPGIHPRAVVADSVTLGQRVAVGANAVIDAGCTIGDDCIIGPNVSVGPGCTLGAGTWVHANVAIYSGTRIGRRVLIHSGAVIGADGFRFLPARGMAKKVPQRGSVQIDDDVEIGANTCIDRAMLGVTHIEAGVKIDNLVHVAHNCVVGANSLLAAQCGLSGSVTVGRGVLMGGQVGVAEHLHIGDAARLCGRAGVTTDVPAKARLFGFPARPDRQVLTEIATVRKLADMYQVLRALVEDRLLVPSSRDGTWDDALAAALEDQDA